MIRPRRALLPVLAAAGILLSCMGGAVEAGSDGIAVPLDRPLNVGFLVTDGVYDTELVAPFDVFQHTAAHTTSPPGMRVFTVAETGQPITTAEGLRLLPDHTFDDAPPIDVLVVPSAEHSRDLDLENPALVDWVGRTGREARLVMSLCWGAFVLGRAGLLDGSRATTFPSDYRSFAAAFPDVDLKVNVSFVHDGKLVTSAGGARSYEAAMYVVSLLYGDEVARGIGGGLLLPWPRGPGAEPVITDPGFRVVRGEAPARP